MKHEKIEINPVKRFLLDNFEDLLLGAAFILGAFFGVLFPLGQAELFGIFRIGNSFYGQLAVTLLPLVCCFVLVFFCGTSPIGFLSPSILFLCGLLIGTSVDLFLKNHSYGLYLLCCLPVLLFTGILLVRVTKTGLSLSARLLMLCTGGGAADLSLRFRLFLRQSVVCFLLLILGCVLFSALRFYVFAG